MADNASGDAPSPAPTAPGPPPEAAARPPWYRRHVPYMLAVAALAPLTYLTPWWLEYDQATDWGRRPPAAVSAEAGSAALAGSDWEFVGARTEDIGGGMIAVAAGFAVQPNTAVATERLRTHCRLRATDDRGRTWVGASYPYGTAPLYFETAGELTGGGCAFAPPDQRRFPVDEASLLIGYFAVPRDALGTLRFEAEVATHDPADSPEITDKMLAEGVPPEVDRANPPEPDAVSFAYRGQRLDRAELFSRSLAEPGGR